LHRTVEDKSWTLYWFDKNSNTSYSLGFSGPNVITIFEPLGGLSTNNVAAAQKLGGDGQSARGMAWLLKRALRSLENSSASF
jgi:hypothetical protein